MADVFTKKKRSEVMSLIKSKNSKAELLVFKYLNQRGVYYQKHYRRATGTPDIALPRKKRAVFIDGDFWHGRRLDDWIMKNGKDNYWAQKIIANIERDQRNRSDLISSGWQVLTVWESDINRKRTQALELAKISDFLIA